MKKLIILIFTIVISSNFFSGCIKKPSLHPSKLTFEPIKFNPPSPEIVILDNGLKLYLLQDDELPLFNVKVMLKTGSVYESREKIGLASITGSVMRTGGTKFMTGDEINEELEFISGSIETSIGSETGSASLSVLKKDTKRGLKLLSDILKYPVFDEKKITLVKNQILESIRRKNDNPKGIASREFNKLIYKGHPYGDETTVESINNIKRDDLLAFHKKYYYPNNMILGISGDFDKKEIIDLLNGYFLPSEKKDITFPEVKALNETFKNSVNYVYKDVPQSVIKVGHFGIKYENTDLYTLRLMNYILGGGSFQSRLMKEIRSEKGLAYSVWSDFGVGNRVSGVFMAYAETKASTTALVIELIKENIERIQNEYVTDEELNTAKEYIVNSFIFRFNSNAQILGQIMYIDFFNLPKDYLKNYRANIKKVTKEDIKRAANKYLHPDELIYMVVGDNSKFDNPLTTFGDVNEIKLKEDSK